MKTIKQPEILTTPFRVSIDSNESSPYSFTGIKATGDRHNRMLVVPTTIKPLFAMGKREVETRNGMFIKGLADYSIDGFEEQVQVERKSKVDLYSTLGQRRHEFEAEIVRLQECDFAAVVIEADWADLLNGAPNSQLSPTVVIRTILSWSVRYPRCHWFTCRNRRMGELVTFRLLSKFWEVHCEQESDDSLCSRKS